MIILYVNGYNIRWNPIFEEFIVREPETGAGEDFKTIEEAITHAKNG
jgi:hypothetical protein